MSANDLRQRILDAARAQPSPTRRASRQRAMLLIVGAAAATLALFVAIGGVRATQRPPSLIVGTTLGAAVLALVAIWSVLGRGRSMLGRSRRWLLALVLALPPALLAWKMGYSACYSPALALGPYRLGLRCFGWMHALAAWPLAAFLILRSGREPRHPALLGAAFGISSAACAWVLVDLWCPVARTPHLLLGHLLPTVLLGLVGAAIGRLVLAVRAR
jgi:hypothetical protein